MHTLRVEKDGYVSHQSTVEVSAGGMVEREVRLEAFEGGSARLTVRLNPPDALLRVDGRLVTATEISGFIEVPSGRAVLLEATHDGHQPFKQTLKFDAGSSQSHALVLTQVKLRRLTIAEIAAYIATGEWHGKAGGYGIQGRAEAFIPWLNGSYSNVVGLPLTETCNLLAQFGIHPVAGEAK
jgi:septum formation protein